MGKHRSQQARYERLQKITKAGFTARAILEARRFVADFPSNCVGWLTLGLELVKLARYDEAERALMKALDLCPMEMRQLPLHQIGRLFCFKGDRERAAEWHRKGIDAAPTNATGYIFLGVILATQERRVEAEAVLRSATECIEGCIHEAFLNLGFLMRAQERFDQAAECFREAIHLHPSYRAAKKALRDTELCLKLLNDRS